MILRCLFIACIAPLLFASGTFAEGTFQLAKDGRTYVWNNYPQPGDEASWSGNRNAKGYATGSGTLTWYKGSVLVSSYSGTMVGGKLDGVVTNEDANGKKFRGTFVNGKKSADWAEVSENPSESPTPILQSRFAALAQANQLAEATKFQEAVGAYRAALKQFPDFKEAYAGLGHALVGAQQYRDAIDAYNAAIRMDAEYTGGYVGRAWTRWFTGDLEGAAADYHEVIRMNPENLLFYKELERVLFEMNRPLEVADLWKTTFQQFPEWTNAKVWRVQALVRAEAWDTLLTEVPDVLKLKGLENDPYLFYLLGRAYNESNQHDEAVSNLERSVDAVRAHKPLDTASLKIYGEELMYTYVWNGQQEKAQEWQRELQSLLPKTP